jgi:hypothetical protein
MTAPKDESRIAFERRLSLSQMTRADDRYYFTSVQNDWELWQESRRAFADELVKKCQAARLPELPRHLQPATDMRLSFNDGVECVIDIIRKEGGLE